MRKAYGVLILAASIAGFSSCKKDKAENQPVSCFAFTTTVVVDSTVSFTNCSQHAASYTWYFGDGTTSNIHSPTHSYSDTGTFNILLIAHNEVGNDTLTAYMTVTPLPKAFDGKFLCIMTCQNGSKDTGTVTMTPGWYDNYIWINGLGFYPGVEAKVSGNTIDIPLQNYTPGFFMVGCGGTSHNHDTVFISYTKITGSTPVGSCGVVCIRQ